MTVYNTFQGTGFTPVDLAERFVAGDIRDYVFFNTSATQSVLLVSESFVWSDADTITTDFADIYVFDARVASAPAGASNNYYYLLGRGHDSFTVEGMSTGIIYSSYDGYPHLRKDGDYYAFAITFLLLITCFVLLWTSITRMLYRRA